jgi:hypothetical protein
VALLLRRLRRNARPRVGLVHPPLDQPLDPRLCVGGHHHDERERRRHPGFDEQRDVLDHDGVVGHGFDDLQPPLTDQRVHDGVQLGALFVVDERLGRQCRPVQRPVRQQDVLAELLDQLGQPLGAGFDDLARDDVTVDDDAATFSERGGHRRLAGANTAGQTDAQHARARLGAAGELLPQGRELGIAGQRPAGLRLVGS